MSVDTSGSSDEDKPIFRPLTRDSLAQIQARIDSEHAKKKELDRKRAEGEVSRKQNPVAYSFSINNQTNLIIT